MIDRSRILEQVANARRAAADPAWPQHIRALYRKAADHGDVALGLHDAVLRRQVRELQAEAVTMLPGLASWLLRKRPPG